MQRPSHIEDFVYTPT